MSIEYISLIMSVLSLLIACLTYFVTRRTYNAQFEQMRNQKLPNLKIISVEFCKSKYGTSDSVYDGKYCRIYNGKSTINMSLDDNMAIFDASDKQIENGFIEEIKSYIGRFKDHHLTFITYLGDKLYLIANHASDKDRFIIDHSALKITLHNYGAAISYLNVESISAYYKEEIKIDRILFNGYSKNIITLSPDENEKFILYLDEVTTDLNNSLCQMSTSTYIDAPESLNLLRSHLDKNIFNFDKLIIYLRCWDMYNNLTRLKITFEYNGLTFASSTKVLKLWET